MTMRDRLFDGFTMDEAQGIFAAASRAAEAIAACCPKGEVHFDVMGLEQTLHLRTQGVVVSIQHPPGEELEVVVHHNKAYPLLHGNAQALADMLGVEVK